MVTRRELPDGEAPELIPYRTMKAQHSHLGFGVFVAEGDKLVHRLTRLLSGPAIGARASVILVKHGHMATFSVPDHPLSPVRGRLGII